MKKVRRCSQNSPSVRREAFNLEKEVLCNLRIEEQQFKTCGEAKKELDAQRMLLQDIKEKLLGKTVRAKGSIVLANDRLYSPKTIFGVSGQGVLNLQ